MAGGHEPIFRGERFAVVGHSSERSFPKLTYGRLKEAGKRVWAVDSSAAEETAGDNYRVSSDRGVWAARNVVIATGHCDVPWVPPARRGTGRRRPPDSPIELSQPEPARVGLGSKLAFENLRARPVLA